MIEIIKNIYKKNHITIYSYLQIILIGNHEKRKVQDFIDF